MTNNNLEAENEFLSNDKNYACEKKKYTKNLHL